MNNRSIWVHLKGGDFMTLKNAIEVAIDCNLETVGEAVFNVDMHCLSMFSNARPELDELHKEFNLFLREGLITKETDLNSALNILLGNKI